MALHKVLNRHGRVLAPGPALAQFPVEASLATQPLCQRLPDHKGLVKSLLVFPLQKRWKDKGKQDSTVLTKAAACFLFPGSCFSCLIVE